MFAIGQYPGPSLNACGNEYGRQQQAIALNRWLRICSILIVVMAVLMVVCVTRTKPTSFRRGAITGCRRRCLGRRCWAKHTLALPATFSVPLATGLGLIVVIAVVNWRYQLGSCRHL